MAGFRGTQRVSVGAGMTVAFALLAACGGSAPAPVPAQPSEPRHETVRVGNVTVRANTLRTTDLDYFAVVEASPPDTLRFDLDIAWPGGPGATLRVEHELRPD